MTDPATTGTGSRQTQSSYNAGRPATLTTGTRPFQSPLGPRSRASRFAGSPMADAATPSTPTSTSASTASAGSNRDSTLSLLTPMTPSPPYSPSARSETKLAPITEQEQQSHHAYPFSSSSRSPSSLSSRSVTPAADTAAPSSPAPHQPPPTAPASSRPLAPKAALKLVPPVPAPAIKFESELVAWKGLTLDAAMWTMDPAEYQGLVSQAIKMSGRESFLRLLTIEMLEISLPKELERLNHRKEMAQAKYRFLVHRRTMLFHALNSSSTGAASTKNDATDDVPVVSRLTQQVSQTAAESDQLVEELVRITDQIAQIQRLIDVHYASALAVALRKLNKSYGRRTAELLETKNRVTQLEAELEEAWKEAERMAKEVDELEARAAYAYSDDDEEEGDEEAVIEVAEKVALPNPAASRVMSPEPTGATLLHVEPRTPLSPLFPTPFMAPRRPPPSIPLPPVPVSVSEDGHDDESERGHERVPPFEVLSTQTAAQDVPTPDTASIRSAKSGKSGKSGKSARSRQSSVAHPSRTSIVSAARVRSQRTSKNSLRLPRMPSSLRRSQKQKQQQQQQQGPSPAPPTPAEEHPPVPDIPFEFAPPLPLPLSPRASSTLLHASSSNPSLLQQQFKTTRRGSLDWSMSRAAQGHRRSLSSSRSYAPTVTMDDINVHPRYPYSHAPPPLPKYEEIEVVPRTPPYRPAYVDVGVREQQQASSSDGQPPPTRSIPNFWLRADTGPTRAASEDALSPSTLTSASTVQSKQTSYSKLKTLTKRYSMSIFGDKSSSSSTSKMRPFSRRSH